MACAGDIPTLETLAAVGLLRQYFTDLRIRVVNVVDLMALQSPSEHPRGLAEREFDAMFTTDNPVVFAYHGYPSLTHRLEDCWTNHRNLHVHGYREEGTTTTSCDMTVLNRLERFHLAANVIQNTPRLAPVVACAKQTLREKLTEHKLYIEQNGQALPEIRDWKWRR